MGVIYGSGGNYMSDTTLQSGGIYHGANMVVLSGGTAKDIDIYSGGYMMVLRGGAYNYRNYGGIVDVNREEWGAIFSSNGSYQKAEILSNRKVGNGGYLLTLSGGTYRGVASRTTVLGGGHMIVASGGVAARTIVSSGGTLIICDGGNIGNVTRVLSGGYMLAGGNATLTGTLQLGGETLIGDSSVKTSDCRIAMDISERTPYTAQTAGDDFFVYGLSYVADASLSVKQTFHQRTGTYRLARLDGDFSKEISVSLGIEEAMTEAISLTCDGSYTLFWRWVYSLRREGNYLYLDIMESGMESAPVTVFSNGIVTNYDDEIIGDVLASGVNTLMISVDGGIARETHVNRDCSLFVAEGGSAVATTVRSGGNLNVLSQGTANDSEVLKGGMMYVADEGVANRTKLAGSMRILENGVANSNTVKSGGVLEISSDGTAKGNTISGGGNLQVYGSAKNTTVKTDGTINVYDGGVAENTTVKNAGTMRVHAGGSAISTQADAYCSAYVSSGGFVLSTTVNQDGRIHVLGGGEAGITDVKNGGEMHVSGGFAAYITVSGKLHVHKGITDIVTVKSGGHAYVSAGGVAGCVTVNRGGSLTVFAGAWATVVYNPWNGAKITSKTGAAITYLRDKNVYYGGLASGIVSSADTMSDLRITSGNSAVIFGNGVVTNTTVKKGGTIIVSSGGIVRSADVTAGGSMHIIRGGTATVAFDPWRGKITSSGKVTVKYLSRDSKVYYGGKKSGLLKKGNTISGLKVTSGNSALVYKGGTASVSTIASGGSMFVSSGGLAQSASVRKGGTLRVEKGGRATITFDPWRGKVSSGSGAKITYLARDSKVYYGGNKSGLVKKGNTMSGLAVTSGNSALVYKGGIVSKTVVKSGGTMKIMKGGTGSNTTVSKGGIMLLSGGAMQRGSLQIASGAKVSACKGAIIDFSLAGRSAGAGYLINDLSWISGTPTYTITVTADQKTGKYKLAQGASKFNATVTAKLADGTTLGKLKIGTKLMKDGYVYALSRSSGNLALSITKSAVVASPPITSSVAASTTNSLEQPASLSAPLMMMASNVDENIGEESWENAAVANIAAHTGSQDVDLVLYGDAPSSAVAELTGSAEEDILADKNKGMLA